MNPRIFVFANEVGAHRICDALEINPRSRDVVIIRDDKALFGHRFEIGDRLVGGWPYSYLAKVRLAGDRLAVTDSGFVVAK